MDQDHFNTLLDEYQLTSPVLLFCNDQLASSLSNLYQNTSVQDEDILESGVLDRLEQQLDKRYPLLLVTDTNLMRAIDYRAPTLGIVLIVTKSFDHNR